MFDTCENSSRWYCRTVPSWHVHGSLHSRFAWDTQPVHGLHSLKCSLSGVFMPLKSSFGECACGPTRFSTRPALDEQINNMPFFSFLFFWVEGKILIKTKTTGLHMSLIVSNDKRSSHHSKKGSLILYWNRICDGGPHLMDGLDHEPCGHHLSTTSWIPTPTLTSQSYVAHGLLWTCAKAASESWRKACK